MTRTFGLLSRGGGSLRLRHCALLATCVFVLGLLPGIPPDRVAAAPPQEAAEQEQPTKQPTRPEPPQRLPVPRILEQDSARNNLVDPPGYEPAELGTLGRIERRGDGPRPMILVPGFGFGGEVFEPVMAGREDRFTMYAVTLPGFAGTPAPPSPPEGTSFGEQTWTTGAVDAISELMREEDLRDVVLVGHWLGGTQVAIELALRHPERVDALVLLAGSARWIDPGADPGAGDEPSLDERIASIDSFMAPRWFKTVTRETWDDNNFLPGDYAANPVLGLRLWRMAAEPPLHVWVRYLNEFFAQDVSLKLGRLDVPTLLLHPGLEGLWHPRGNDYVRGYLHGSWGDRAAGHPRITVDTIPDTRIVPWYDRPEAVNEAIDDFLARDRTIDVGFRGEQLAITMVGNAGVVLTDGTTSLLVDLPYESGAFGYMTYDAPALDPPGAVTSIVTHGHADHFDPALFVDRDQWRILGPPGVTRNLPPSRVVRGDSVRIGEFTVIAIPTPHTEDHRSYRIRWRGRVLHFTGDTEDPEHLRASPMVDLLFVTPWLSCAESIDLAAIARRRIAYHVHPGGEDRVCGDVEVPEQGASFTFEGRT